MNKSLELIPSSKPQLLLKGMLLWFFLLSQAIVALGQTESLPEEVVITSLNGKTGVRTSKNGELQVNVSPKDVHTFRRRGWVRYGDFGAQGDGKTDDIDAIAGAHAFTNQGGAAGSAACRHENAVADHEFSLPGAAGTSPLNALMLLLTGSNTASPVKETRVHPTAASSISGTAPM